jgi:signal transduction histidine kinase
MTPAARRRTIVAVLAILGVAVSLAASLYVLDHAAEATAANAIVRSIMALTALTVGLYLWWRQPHNRYGIVLAAAAFVLSPMALAVSEDPWTFTVGRTFGAAAVVYAVFLALIFPDGRADERAARLVLAATVVVSVVLWTAALLLAETLPAGGPFVPCFEDCPQNQALVFELSPDPSDALGIAYGLACAGLGLGAAAVLVGRMRDASPVRRRAIGPILAVILVVCIGLGAYIFARQLAPDSAVLDPLGWLVLGGFLLFPFVIGAGLIRGRVLAASALERLVERISREQSPAAVQAALREAVQDPSLELLLWSSSKSSYLDARGRDVQLPDRDPGRSVTRVDRHGRPVAAIVHDPGLDGRPEAIRAVASAALIAMENARSEVDEDTIAFEERRRIARDLHDGMAQDLAFISAHGRELAQQDPRAEGIAMAAQRALAESRTAIITMTGSADEPLPTAVERMAVALADRSGVRLELELDEEADAEPEAGRELLRIVSEAISNAIRHGEASMIRVSLSTHDGLRLAISDDGCGFDLQGVRAGRPGCIGLTNMQVRAEDLGGELRVRSRPGEGTEVLVALPERAYPHSSG